MDLKTLLVLCLSSLLLVALPGCGESGRRNPSGHLPHVRIPSRKGRGRMDGRSDAFVDGDVYADRGNVKHAVRFQHEGDIPLCEPG